MILILKNLHRLLFLFLGVFLTLPFFVHAQESLTLSVTPPLFQLSAVREQVWQSNIKVINSNSYPITVYANPVNFAPVGEEGRGQFVPIFENDTEGSTLAEWIAVTREAIVIPAEQSIDIPFIVSVPEDAAPGGHFAAILIGTKPPEKDAAMAVRTAQVVSSLFFLSIDGNVIEQGSIREFSVDDSFVNQPQAHFLLRFENDGNVHVRPQGEIKIVNMWGKERGVIPINHGSHFGNVLPNTIRKFDFSWTGESSISDIGKYTAIVTLGYGSKARQSVSQEVSFWVIPIKATLITLGVLIVLLLLIRWAIKSYVRHMLVMAGIDPDERAAHKESGAVVMNKKISYHTAPNQLKKKSTNTLFTIIKEYWLVQFISEYRYFFVGIPSAMLLLGLVFWYMSGALVAERNFEATIGEGDSEIKINSEELKRQEQTDLPTIDSSAVITEDPNQAYDIRLINVSGVPGAAAQVSIDLERAGYIITALEPELDRTQNSTVVVTDESLSHEAKAISELLDNALVSFTQNNQAANRTAEIIIYIGKDVLTE